jgi:hypothetical protein
MHPWDKTSLVLKFAKISNVMALTSMIQRSDTHICKHSVRRYSPSFLMHYIQVRMTNYMGMRVCACMHIYAHMHIHTHVDHVDTYIRVGCHMDTYLYTHIFVYIDVRVSKYVQACACT